MPRLKMYVKYANVKYAKSQNTKRLTMLINIQQYILNMSKVEMSAKKENIPVGRWNGVSFLIIEKCAALQVRCKSLSEMKKEKAFYSASQPGSFTIEAALGLALFIFAMVSLMLPIRITHIQRQVQAVLESVNEELCQYAYGVEPKDSDKRELLYSVAGSLYIKGKITEQLKEEGVKDISMLGTKILEDGETIDLQISYCLDIPFPIEGLPKIRMSARSFRRAWIGKSGLLDWENGGNKKGQKEQREEDFAGETVYIGNTRSRYHLYADCHYLFNDIETVEFSSIKERRNRFGERYQPCDVCGDTVGDMVVYIMPGGEKYHSNRNCSSIQAYVREVSLKEAENLGICSYCEKRKEKQ